MPVNLHALAEHHIPQVLEACHDWKELAQHGPPYWRPRSSAELRRKIVDAAGPQLAQAYSFVLADDSQLVGETSIHAIDWRNRVAQVGICIWRPEDRRRGYGRAGAEAAISWALDELGLLRLEAWILATNKASQELFAGLDFAYEGTLTGRYQHGGVRHDVVVYGLTR
ncbi:GNAT family N-acetyltransferase [Actinomyces glycerinitolerans]|uniref:Acyl-coa n-acyltransferase n=1 Tax=Actinomyces glycerinitolerans TaxID=1892869 RepID=A0A1M4S022_9ACTO|nr:GNAT family protein [Actinomyces glycerinitolerans]SHE25574.1 acyl-coa n-acyltransferase [Actinomyces glycerinitolerans]